MSGLFVAPFPRKLPYVNGRQMALRMRARVRIGALQENFEKSRDSTMAPMDFHSARAL